MNLPFALGAVGVGIVTSLLAMKLGYSMAEHPVEYWSIFLLGMACYILGNVMGK